MAALLVSLSVMAVVMTMAMPLWKTAAKREKEAELVFRGTQYARAVAMFQRKYANAYPPNLDILLNERFLRKKYKDPMTKDGEFQLLPGASGLGAPGQIAGGGGGAPGAVGVVPQQGQGGRPSQLDSGPRMPAGTATGVGGVVSKSSDPSLRLFNGRSKYNEWTFTPQTVGLMVQPAGGAGQRPGMPGGSQIPGPGGMRPGPGGRGPMGNQPFGQGGFQPGGFGGPGGQQQPRPQQPGQPQPGQQPRPFGIRPPG